MVPPRESRRCHVPRAARGTDAKGETTRSWIGFVPLPSSSSSRNQARRGGKPNPKILGPLNPRRKESSRCGRIKDSKQHGPIDLICIFLHTIPNCPDRTHGQMQDSRLHISASYILASPSLLFRPHGHEYSKLLTAAQVKTLHEYLCPDRIASLRTSNSLNLSFD